MRLDSPDSSAAVSRWWTSRAVSQVPSLLRKKSCMVRGCWNMTIYVLIFDFLRIEVLRWV